MPIVLLHLGPATNRISAVLVVQVPNGTHMQSPSELSFGTEVVYGLAGPLVYMAWRIASVYGLAGPLEHMAWRVP